METSRGRTGLILRISAGTILPDTSRSPLCAIHDADTRGRTVLASKPASGPLETEGISSTFVCRGVIIILGPFDRIVPWSALAMMALLFRYGTLVPLGVSFHPRT